MQQAALIVNPSAGRAAAFQAHREAIQRIFADRKIPCHILHTTPSPGSATTLAAEAARHHDLIIACGGDGTVHGVLQGVVDTPACLGVLPFGTGNALARNLGLPLNPTEALKHLLTFSPTTIPTGIAETSSNKRHFLVMAGVGPDGRLIHEMSLTAKSRLGRTAYYAEAVRLFLTRRFPPFHIAYRSPGSPVWHHLNAVALLAARVPDLGGLFTGLSPHSRLHQPCLNVQALAAPAHQSQPARLTLGALAPRLPNPWLTTLQAEELLCTPIHRHDEVSAQTFAQVFAQIDGEPAGPIPLRLTIQPASLRILLPPQAAAG